MNRDKRVNIDSILRAVIELADRRMEVSPNDVARDEEVGYHQFTPDCDG